MARLTLAYAAILIALGLVAYFVLQPAGDRSMTALIPAFFGIVFALLGGLALNARLRKHAMHGAAVLALLVVIPTAGAIPQLPAALEAAGEPAPAETAAPGTGEEVADAAADAVQDAGENASEALDGTAPDAEATEEEPIRVNAIIVQAVTCGLSIAFLVACVASFVQARRGGGSTAG